MSAQYQVGVAVADVRRAPALDAALDTQALLGERVLVLPSEVPLPPAFVRVRLALDGYEGFIVRSALMPLPSAPADHCVVVPRSFVFPQPDFKCPPVLTLSLGSQVRVLSVEGGYARLEHGYIAASHLQRIPELAGDFVSHAQSLLHTPYLWGGKSAFGIDCSGLVQLSLSAIGSDAPRDSGPQRQDLGMLVSEGALPSLLERGDLLFWKDHVAIALDSSQMIHANVHHMRVNEEPIRPAILRIAAKDNPLLCVRRICKAL